MKRTTLSLTLLATLTSFSAVANLEQQRQTYQKINELLAISQSDATQKLAHDLFEQIKDYPLAPYAEARLLNANKANLTLTDIETYQQKNPNLPFANQLKKEWLKQLQEKQDWKTILDNAGKLPLDQGSQCILVQAKSYNAAIEAAQNTVQSEPNEKTEEKPTALLPKFTQDDLATIWLTGQSLPSQCDALLTQWHEQGGLTPELAKQRAVMAYEQGNSGLLSHLEKMLKDEKNQRWAADLNALLKSPANLMDDDNLFYVDIIPNKPLEKRVVLATFPAYVKTLKEEDIQEPAKYFEHFETWAKSFSLTPEQLVEWKKLYLSQFFDSTNTEFQDWRDEQLTTLKDDSLTERRIRMAIREKGDYAKWISLLSDTAKEKEEWQYWIAQTTEDKLKSKEILTALAKKRGFYAMLAAKELGIQYQPEMLKLVEPTSKPGAMPQIDVTFQAELARIAELRYFDDTSNMNSEWRKLLDNATFEQKLQLSYYAAQQGWYDLGVEATIQAKAWDYLSLRLPNAYSDWFEINLKGKKISRTFAMAIARQESAWKTHVTSAANARGLMQLLPTTAKLTAEKTGLPYSNDAQLFDPFNNIMLGTAHLQELFDKYGDNRILIAAAYNAGAQRVDQWLEKAAGKLTMAEFVASIPFYETRGYVQNVMAYDSYYQILQQQPQQLFSKEETDRLY